MRIERDDPGPITRPRGTDDTGPPSGSTHSAGDSPELELLGRIAATVRGAHDAGVPF